MIACSWPIITTYKSVLAILISPTDLEAVAVVGVTFSGILLRGEVSSTYKYW